MKPRASMLTVLVVAICAVVVLAQAPPAPSTPPAKSTVPDRAALEKEFADSLTGATLVGTWQMTGKDGLKGNEPMTDPKPDEYVIAGVTKAGEDLWIVQAKIGFANNDLVVPVPVRVVWAEDTAIITLNDLAVPMIGTYSARVMIHHGFYSGVWYSNVKNYGGVMQGKIVKKSAGKPGVDATKPATETPKPAPPSGDRKE